MTNSHLPVEQTKRTPIVDILRGWALLGVAIGNYVDFLYIGITPEKINHSVFSEILLYINRYFFAAKSSTIPSYLSPQEFGMPHQDYVKTARPAPRPKKKPNEKKPLPVLLIGVVTILLIAFGAFLWHISHRPGAEAAAEQAKAAVLGGKKLCDRSGGGMSPVGRAKSVIDVYICQTGHLAGK